MWNTSEFYCESKHMRFVWGNVFATNLYFNVFEVLKTKIKNKLWRKDKIEWKLWWRALISKFDEMISGQGILSRKKKEVEMSTIRTLVNDVTCGRCNEERETETWEEMKQSWGKRLYLLTIIEIYNKLQTLSQGSRSVDEYI